MRILSVRQGFASDHSSTSYEFLAIDKPLSKESRSKVSSLSKRVNPTARRASFEYHVDGYDIPCGWEELMKKYYDVMYSESYGSWILGIAFNCDWDQYVKICPYEFEGSDEVGSVEIESYKGRVVITINCIIDSWFDSGYDSEDYDEDDEDYEDDEGESGQGNENVSIVTDDGLLQVLAEIRQQIMSGDYRALYALWETYGDEEAEDQPPIPESRDTGAKTVKNFKDMLGKI